MSCLLTADTFELANSIEPEELCVLRVFACLFLYTYARQSMRCSSVCLCVYSVFIYIACINV